LAITEGLAKIVRHIPLKSHTSGEVFGPGLISKSFKYRARVKKVGNRRNVFWKSSLLPHS